MSESSADKTKRELINYISNYRWEQQISLWPALTLEDYEQDCQLAVTVISDGLNLFKDRLRRKFKDTAFLIIVRASGVNNANIRLAYPQRKPIQQIYVTIYSSQILDRVKRDEVIDNTYSGGINLQFRSLTEDRIKQACRTIKNQKLHDLKKLLPDAHMNMKRRTILNESKLILRQKTFWIKSDCVNNSTDMPF